MAGRVEADSNRVEADPRRPVSRGRACGEPFARHPTQATTLVVPDRREGTELGGVASGQYARLDLAEDELTGIAGHDVELTMPAAEVRIENL